MRIHRIAGTGVCLLVWIVPFGGAVGKGFRVGNQVMNLNAQLFYNAVPPDTAPSANLPRCQCPS